MITPVSATFIAEITSPTKSSYPGVSMMLILEFFHLTCISVLKIEVPHSFSSVLKSEVLVPSAILPILLIAPDSKSIVSAKLVFPHPECPIKTTFRISFVSKPIK